MKIIDSWEDGAEYIFNTETKELEIKYEGEHLITLCPASINILLKVIETGRCIK